MSIITEDCSNYRVHLEQFDGPLELLLHLVREAKLDITEISLAAVSGQYFSYLRQMQSLNIEIESSYLVVFAQLLELKSRLLLPPDQDSGFADGFDASDLLDPSEQDDAGNTPLVDRLNAYAMVRKAADWLSLQEQKAASRYTRPKADRDEEQDRSAFELQISLESLASAFQKLSKAGHSLVRPITLDRVVLSVPERIEQLKTGLKEGREYLFWTLLNTEGDLSRPRAVVTFLALLQMAKEHLVNLEQTGNGKDIKITR